ncbi:MAG: membrane protein insertase YidC [Spirochaetales bacterium]|nr:membrane protein insertase YidC [Candidatus Physcosoma equi]
MDRNTIIAVILCVIVITVGMTFQQSLLSRQALAEEEAMAAEMAVADTELVGLNAASHFAATGKANSSSEFTVTSGSLELTFDPVGGTISSIKDVQHNNEQLLLKEDSDANAFMMYWGADKSASISDVFNYTVETKEVAGKSDSITQVTFSREYKEANSGKTFTLEKRYAIPNNNEYMIQLAVTIYSNDGTAIPINVDNSMYTLSVGPQVGPSFKSLSRNYDYRRVYYKRENKNGKTTANFSGGVFNYKEEVDWVGVVGKYFAFLVIPETDGIISNVSAVQNTESEAIPQKDTVYLTRQATGASKATDVYSFYIGPQLSSTLGIYDNAKDNIFGLADHNLKKALDVSWLSWLESILKVILVLFYKLIPNYGIAIILLTILTKLITLPFTKKSTESTAKMSALQPKMKEIQEKYKDDPQAQNEAISKLYREEGINPMGSCWPMLIQFPIFIALYGLLNKNFDLRGAMFISGWINDLSIPETVFTLPFNLPFLGADIHVLPIVYTLSMIFSMKITQTGNTQAGSEGTMWFMTYGMSIMFFFILYNAPSGLLLYWTVSNAISIGQQLMTNKKKLAGFQSEIAAHDAEKAAKKAAKKKNR